MGLSPFFSPLEQFELYPVFCSVSSNLDLAFFIFSSYFIFLFVSITYINFLVPTSFLLVVKVLFFFVFSLLLENLGIKYIKYFPFIFFLFVYILSANLSGMIPYVLTITSHFCVTFAFAYAIWFSATYLGLYFHGTGLSALFLPSGCPLLIIPFIIVIEIISYVARMFSLSIRLFANMMSGHTLLHILSKFSWNLLSLGFFGGFFLLFPFCFLGIITVLELAIAFLQCYVFIVLFLIYLEDTIVLNH